MKTFYVLLLCLMTLLLAERIAAQSTNASITGRVTDPQKSVIVGAHVTAINTGTNVRYEGTSNNTGSYLIPNLPPGPYRVEIERPGFKTVVETGVVLHVQDTVELNYEMALGAVSESVTVTADQNNINTTDGSVSTTIDRNFAENLPLNGRSFQTLILLAPGTVLNGNGNSGGTFSVNGQRTNTNPFTVDGVSAVAGNFQVGVSGSETANGANPGFSMLGTTQGMVSVDALQEFKIQTSTYAPEFGRQPGGQVSLLTRSGTDGFHGTGFDYFRNTVLDANNWFNGFEQSPPLPKGAERQNDFGGTIGGPIFKDKTFFFFSYEGLRLLVPFTRNQTVPSVSLRQEAAPSLQSIVNYFPLPNPNSPSSGNSGVFTLNASDPLNLDDYSIRIDHTLADKIHFFGRYTHTASSVSGTNSFFAGQASSNKLTSQGLTLGADFPILPVLSNELRLNYTVDSSTETDFLQSIGGGKVYDSALLFPAPLTPRLDFANFILRMPGVFVASFVGHFGVDAQREINVIDNVSRSLGSHQVKFGIDYRRLFPILGGEPASASYRVNSVADLMAGTLTQVQSGAHIAGHPIYTNFSSYAQDTWRLSNRLTLTYGLRWELNPTPSDRDGLTRYFLNVVGISNPANATLAPAGSPIFKTTYDNFAPRIGLAYQLRQLPGHETVVRGGFGVFYDLDSQTFSQNFQSGAFGSLAVQNKLSFPVANNVLSFPPVPVPQNPPYQFINAIDPNLQLPYALEWNVSVEQGLGTNQSLTASYVASAGRRLLRQDAIENFSPTFENLDVLRNASSSSYQSLQLQFNRRLSHGLQGLASYTYSHSIDNASDGQTVVTAFSGPVLPNPNLDRGNSDFDARHAFRAALTYAIPAWNSNRFSKAFFSGWSVDSIGIAQSGSPVDLVGGFTAQGQVRPDEVPNQPFYLFGSQCAMVMQGLGELNPGTSCPGGMGLNPNAFQLVPTDADGNALRQGTLRRNAVRGFGSWQLDLAIHRQFNFTERINLQFRSEFFNVFNHPNFSNLDGTVGDGFFGLAGSTLNQSSGDLGLNPLFSVGGPRSIQFALKLTF